MNTLKIFFLGFLLLNINLVSISQAEENIISGEQVLVKLSDTNEDSIFKLLSDINDSNADPTQYRQYLSKFNDIALYKDYSDMTRGIAILVIGKVGLPDPKAVDYLLNIANTPASFFIQREVINSLSFWLTAQRNISVLSRMRNKYKFTYQKHDWVEAFLPTIKKQLSSEDKWVRKAAITTLGDAGSYAVNSVNQLLYLYKDLFQIDEGLRKEISRSINKIADDLHMRVENQNLDIETRKQAISDISKLDLIIFAHLMVDTNQSMQSFLYEMPKTDLYLSRSIQKWPEPELTIHTMKTLQDTIQITNKQHMSVTRKPRYSKSFTIDLEFIKPISSRLFDENPDVQISAIKLLATLGKASERAIPTLEKLRKKHPSLENDISEAIKAIK